MRDLFEDPAGGNSRLIGHQMHHYDGPDFVGLPVGQLDDHGALIRSEALVFTGELLEQAYADRRPPYLGGTATLPANAPAGFGANIGYRQETAVPGSYESGTYTDTLRQRLSSRGLPLAMQDALGHETVITYDEPYHLLPIKVMDALGLETSAGYNYRLLQPQSVTDPNGNSTHLLYNPIGLPEKQYVVGTDAQGNASLGGTVDKPEITFEYDFLNFAREGKPVFVHTSRRIHHASDNLSDETIESREYSDGYGRLIQTRAQAEELVFGELGGEVGLTSQAGSMPGAAVGRRVDDSVVVSGWDVFDNKGQLVEKYEPFFSKGWDFQPEADAKKGEHATMFYDPRGQVIRTLNPDGSQQRVIFGRPRFATDLTLTQADLASTDVPAGFDPVAVGNLHLRPQRSGRSDPSERRRSARRASQHPGQRGAGRHGPRPLCRRPQWRGRRGLVYHPSTYDIRGNPAHRDRCPGAHRLHPPLRSARPCPDGGQHRCRTAHLGLRRPG